MVEQMYNFDRARIGTEIYYKTPNMGTGKTIPITLMNRMNIKTTFPVEPFHSITEYNMGYVEKPPEFRFSIGVPSMSNESKLLRALQSARMPFNIACKDVGPDSNTVNSQFTLIKEVLVEARIESRELTVNVGEAPMVLCAGIALRYFYSFLSADKQTVIDVPTEALNYNYYFGGGNETVSIATLFAEWA